jgi:ABC-2 type transport system ATP-binding protein
MKIEIEHVSLAYGETQALNDVRASIDGPGIVGLLGRNGSGKSSLLSIMAAFRRPDAGTVTYDGQPVWENPAVTSQIALIREGGDVHAEDEKLDEIFRYAAWLRPNWNAAMADELATAFRIPRKTNLDKMSRGQRSAVGVVLGLATEAPVTMFDETYLGMDAPARVLFYDLLLNEYMERPRTFILSTHLIEEVSRILESVIIIHEGAVLMQAATDDLLGQGVAVTGPAEQVDDFVRGMTVIGSRDLGRLRSTTIFGGLDASQRQAARDLGLDIAPLELQDLFVHLTSGQEVRA